jgi:hypothetical protein
MQRLFLNARDFSSIKNYVRVIVFALDLQRAFIYDKIELLFRSTTIVLIPRPKLIDDPYLILRVPQQCLKVLISVVAAVAPIFM